MAHTKTRSNKPDEGAQHETCFICTLGVQNNQKGLQCDVCLNWWHTKCLNISDQKYAFLKSDNVSWFCDNCKGASKVLRNQMVTMQQRIDTLEKRMETIEKNAISKEEVTNIVKEELQNEDTVKLIEETIQSNLEEHTPTNVAPQSKSSTMLTVQEYLNDMQEVEKRASNLIIHKLEESAAESNEEQETDDKARVLQILKHIDPTLQDNLVNKTIRLGAKDHEYNRPILIEFTNKESPSNIIKSAKKLKDSQWTVSISKDLPKSIRQLRNHLMTEAKRNTPDPDNFLFKVIGEPGKERVIKTPKNAQRQT